MLKSLLTISEPWREVFITQLKLNVVISFGVMFTTDTNHMINMAWHKIRTACHV